MHSLFERTDEGEGGLLTYPSQLIWSPKYLEPATNRSKLASHEIIFAIYGPADAVT